MITVINFGSTKTPQIISTVNAFGKSCQEISWTQFTIGDYGLQDGIILSGSPTFLTEVSHAVYHQKFACLKEGKVPVLGICFGHQVMGILHGSQIFRGEEVRTKIPIHVVKHDLLFAGLTDITEMNEDHTEGITLPAGFIHLAYSEKYPIEAMRHPTLPLWGTQFHPEVSGENGKRLIGNFLGGL